MPPLLFQQAGWRHRLVLAQSGRSTQVMLSRATTLSGDVRDFADNIERGRHGFEQNVLWLHPERAGDGDALLLPLASSHG